MGLLRFSLFEAAKNQSFIKLEPFVFINMHINFDYLLKGTSINHPEGVRLLITRYKPKAQCRDTQTSVNCVPTGRDNGNK